MDEGNNGEGYDGPPGHFQFSFAVPHRRRGLRSLDSFFCAAVWHGRHVNMGQHEHPINARAFLAQSMHMTAPHLRLHSPAQSLPHPWHLSASSFFLWRGMLCSSCGPSVDAPDAPRGGDCRKRGTIKLSSILHFQHATHLRHGPHCRGDAVQRVWHATVSLP